LELRQYLSVLRNRWLLILLTTVLAAVFSTTLSSSTATYTARATLYVGAQPSSETNVNTLFALDRIMLTYSKMIDTTRFAAPAVRQLGLDIDADDVVEDTTVTPEAATQLLYVEVKNEDPTTAQSLANALADGFEEGIADLEGSAEGEGAELPVKVFQAAALPEEPDATDQIRLVILATLFGLIAGAGMAFLLDYLDVSLRTAADVERRLELPVLGVIPVLSTEAPFTARVTGAAERNRERT
jgi:capsular polysaccharide biosynthesis protein